MITKEESTDKICVLLKTGKPVLCFVSGVSYAVAASMFGKIAVISGIDRNGLFCDENGIRHEYASPADLSIFAN